MDGERAPAVVAPHAPPRRRLGALPALDRLAQRRRELLGELAEHDPLDAVHTARQAVYGIDERTRVGQRLVRAGVQAGADALVGRHEGAQLHVARATQDRAVGADVQLDGVALGRWGRAADAGQRMRALAGDRAQHAINAPSSKNLPGL